MGGGAEPRAQCGAFIGFGGRATVSEMLTADGLRHSIQNGRRCVIGISQQLLHILCHGFSLRLHLARCLSLHD